MTSTKSVSDWVRCVKNARDKRNPNAREYDKRLRDDYGSTWKAMNATSGTQGGYTIAPELAPSIYAAAAEASLMRMAGATVVSMSRATLNVPACDITTVQSSGVDAFLGGLLFTYKGLDPSSLAETEGTVKQVELTANVLTGYSVLSNVLIEDAGNALEKYLLTKIGQAAGFYEDLAYLTGSGVAGPQGIQTCAAALTVTRQMAGQITYQDVAGLIDLQPPGSYDNCCFVCHPKTLPQLLQLKDGANRAMVLTLAGNSGRPRMYIATMPLHVSEKVATLGTKGDLTLFDPRYYIIADSTAGLLIDVSDQASQTLFLKNESVMRVVKAGDGQPVVDGPITLQDTQTQVSPFAVLV